MAEKETHKWYETRFGRYTYYVLVYKPKYKSFGDVYVGYEYNGKKLVFKVMWSGSYDMPSKVEDKEKITELNKATNIESINHNEYVSKFGEKIVVSIFDDVDVSKLFKRTEIEL